MGQEPEELRRDIASGRSEMADTIDAIEDRVSPSRVVERRQQAVKGRLRGWRERVMGSPDDEVYGEAYVVDPYADPYAEPYATGTTATYGTYGGTYETTELAPDMPGGGGGGRPREQAAGMAHEARDKVSGVAHEAGEKARQAPQMARQAPQMARQAPKMAERKAKGNPLAAGLVAFGTGLLAATVLPQSRTERKAVRQVQPELDHAAEEARRAGQDVAQTAKSSAQEEAQGLKESAEGHAEQVKGHAQEAGQELKGHAQEAGKEAKEQAQRAGGRSASGG